MSSFSLSLGFCCFLCSRRIVFVRFWLLRRIGRRRLSCGDLCGLERFHFDSRCRQLLFHHFNNDGYSLFALFPTFVGRAVLRLIGMIFDCSTFCLTDQVFIIRLFNEGQPLVRLFDSRFAIFNFLINKIDESLSGCRNEFAIGPVA